MFFILDLQELEDLHQSAQLKTAAAAHSAAASSSSSLKELEQHYASLYDSLLEYGFDLMQVQAALAALHSSITKQQLGTPGVASKRSTAADVDAALDWLCYNIPAAQLPRRFTGSSAAYIAAGSAGVKVGPASIPHIEVVRIPHLEVTNIFCYSLPHTPLEANASLYASTATGMQLASSQGLAGVHHVTVTCMHCCCLPPAAASCAAPTIPLTPHPACSAYCSCRALQIPVL